MKSIYNKYITNKNMYLSLKSTEHNNINYQLVGGNKIPYYILHSTGFDNLLKILEDNALYPNKYLDSKYWRLSGDNEKNHVFLNLIENNKTIESTYNFGCGLIFSKKILEDNTFAYNDGWYTRIVDASIIVDKSLGNSKREKIIKTILEKLSKKENVLQNNMIMNHEILIEGKIEINKYLIGIICPMFYKKESNKIKNMLKKHKYNRVKIYYGRNLPYIS